MLIDHCFSIEDLVTLSIMVLMLLFFVFAMGRR